jgi:hypothetical protein
VLQDFHDGTFYPESYALFLRSKTNLEDCCFNPWIGYADRTHGDNTEKNSLEPFVLTSSIIRQFKREDSKSWFCAGFIPNLNMPLAAARRGNKGRQCSKSAAIRDWHRCVQVSVQPLKDMQREKPPMFFRRGDRVKCARIESPFRAMVGDNKSQDTVAGRKADCGPCCPRMSRRCLTNASSSAKSVHACCPVNALAIECLSMGALGCTHGDKNGDASAMSLGCTSIPLSDNLDHWNQFMGTIQSRAKKAVYIRCRKLRQKLCVQILHRVIGSHPVDNAFFGLDFGSNKEGIFRATLTDILDTTEEGLIPKFLSVFCGLMGDTQRAKVDSVVELMFGEGHNRSGERNSHPPVSFTRGYTQLTRLSANERLGQLFVLCVLLQTTLGREVLEPRFAIDFDEKRCKARERLARRVVPSAAAQPEVNPNSGDQAALQLNSDDGAGAEDREIDDDGGSEGRDNDDQQQEFAGDDNNEESDDDNDDDDDSGIASDSNTDEVGLGSEVKRNLDRLDLSHMHDGIHPSLDGFHKERSESVLDDLLTDKAVSTLSQVKLPEVILDCRNVKRPHRMARPEAVSFEKEHPRFETTEERKDNSIKLPMMEFVCLAETIISFVAFLKCGCDHLVCDKALELFLRILTSTVERGETTRQWRLQKTLELVHFKADILSVGPASGFLTETGERGLKSWCKQPSRTAQRQGDKIHCKQVCERIHEAVIIKAVAASKPLDEEETSSSAGNEIEARGANVLVLPGSVTVIHQLLPSGKMHRFQLDFQDTILSWFTDQCGTTEAVTSIQLFTELVVPNSDGDSKGGLSCVHIQITAQRVHGVTLPAQCMRRREGMTWILFIPASCLVSFWIQTLGRKWRWCKKLTSRLTIRASGSHSYLNTGRCAASTTERRGHGMPSCVPSQSSPLATGSV